LRRFEKRLRGNIFTPFRKTVRRYGYSPSAAGFVEKFRSSGSCSSVVNYIYTGVQQWRTCCERALDVVQRHFVGNAHESTQRHVARAAVRGSDDLAERRKRERKRRTDVRRRTQCQTRRTAKTKNVRTHVRGARWGFYHTRRLIPSRFFVTDNSGGARARSMHVHRWTRK